MASVDPLVEWSAKFPRVDRLPAQVLPGPTLSSRTALLQEYLRGASHDVAEDVVLSTDWTVEGVLPSITRRISELRIPNECQHASYRLTPPRGAPWEILWGVIGVETLVLDEPYRSMVDSSVYLTSDLFRVIMEARFLARESADRSKVDGFVTMILRWITNEGLTKGDIETLTSFGITRRFETLYHRLDALFFLVVLASQNSLLNRVVLTFDGLEYVCDKSRMASLDDLYVMLYEVTKWTRFGSFPMGILIGWAATSHDRQALRRVHPRLLSFLDNGLSWTRGV